MRPSSVQDPRAKLSRDLVALLADEYKPALDLLQRIYPPGLIQYLNQRPRPPAVSAPRQPERPPPQVSSHRRDGLLRSKSALWR